MSEYPKTMYRANYIRNRSVIEPVRVVKETPSSVFINEVLRILKKSNTHKVCETFEEAKQYLMQEAEHDLAIARRVLQCCHDAVGHIKGMKEKC